MGLADPLPEDAAALVELSPGGLWVSERRLWFGGVKLRTRMTVARLGTGELWVHSPGAPTPELSAALDRLGEVRWIVVPNRYHHLHAPAWKERCPGARLIGPGSAIPRHPGLSLDLDLSDERVASLVPELLPVALRGVPFLDETLFFHARTGTLVGADLMMCGCPADHWTWRWVSRIVGQYGRHLAPPDVRWNTRTSPALDLSLDEICRLPIERILVAHSDPITDRPVEQLREAWAFRQR